MTTLIALLRGINIGGNHPLPMKELSTLLTGMGLREVQTYIQSGNVVFRCDVKNKATLAAKISAAIEAQHRFAPHVLLLDAAELRKAIANNPYPEAEADPKSLSLLFLAEAPQHPDLKSLEAIKTGSERSKLAARAEKLLGVAASGRNWNTVCKLAEMAG